VTPERRRLILICGGLLAVVLVVLGVILVLPGDKAPTPASADGDRVKPVPTTSRPSATDVVRKFAAAFEKGDSAAAGGLTDSAPAATAQLAAVWRGLGPQSVSAEPGAIAGAGGRRQHRAGPARVTWTLGPPRVWTYDSAMTVARSVRTGGALDPALVHPKLTAERGLTCSVDSASPRCSTGTARRCWSGRPTGRPPSIPVWLPVLAPAMARVAKEQSGANGWHVALVDAAGTELERLAGSDGETKPLTASLSIPAQRAAQAAVATGRAAGRLVAIQPSTGDILAVAQNGPAGTDPKALNGLYAPGSTFKIATATAALMAGAVTPNTVLPCPVRSRSAPGPSPTMVRLATCRCTPRSRGPATRPSARLAADLGPDALSQAAARLGSAPTSWCPASPPRPAPSSRPRAPPSGWRTASARAPCGSARSASR
jgi:hypothetical protein